MDCCGHNNVDVATTEIVGVIVIEIVVMAVLVQVVTTSSPITIYVCVETGLALTILPVEVLSVADGNHE